MKTYPIVELLGDGISAELSSSVHRAAKALPFRLEFHSADLSEENRRRVGPALYDDVERLLRRHRVGIKYPTATVGESPNRILRDRCRFTVIHRPVCTIPGIPTNFTKPIDLDVVRIGTGGTYEDAGRRIGADTAVSLRVMERRPARDAARFAFKLALLRKRGVVSTSKYTIQRAADGLFEEVVGAVSEDYPGVPYRRELFDALLAHLAMRPERYQVIVCPNEYGDFLSDMACGLIGSVGLGDSASYSFDETGAVELALFDPSGGTAPDIAGRDLCNPTAALFALASLLRHLKEPEASNALRSAVLETIASGRRTTDIGGTLGTREFAGAVAEALQQRLATV